MSKLTGILAGAAFLAVVGASQVASAQEAFIHCSTEALTLSLHSDHAVLSQDEAAERRTTQVTTEGWPATLDGQQISVYAKFNNGWYVYQQGAWNWYLRMGTYSVGLDCESID